jgi:hypothetical protein
MNDSLLLLAQSYNENKALRLLLKLFPHGSMVDNTLASFYTKEKERRIRVFFDELSKGTIPLSEDELQSDDFLHKYFITIKAVLETKRDEKIRYFARLLLQAFSDLINRSTDSYEDFLKILDELTYQEIFILIFIRSFEKEYDGPRGLNNMGMYRPLKTKLASVLGVSEDEVFSYFVRLQRTGLVRHFYDSVFDKEVHSYILLTDIFQKLEILTQL